MRCRALGVAVIALALAGCVPGTGTAAPPTQTLEPPIATSTPLPVTATVTPSPPPGPVGVATIAAGSVPVPQQAQILVGMVIDDLARSLGVASDAIGVVEVEEVTWPDAALGCDSGPDESSGGEQPDEGRVEGFRVVLTHQGNRYIYHTDSQEHFLVCPSDAELEVGEPVILDPIESSLVDLARRSLAERLDLPARRVFLVAISPIEWPDTSLGCPSADQEYVSAAVLGYRIVLRVGRQQYYYHSNFQQVVFCSAEAERLPVTPTPGETATPVGAE